MYKKVESYVDVAPFTVVRFSLHTTITLSLYVHHSVFHEVFGQQLSPIPSILSLYPTFYTPLLRSPSTLPFYTPLLHSPSIVLSTRSTGPCAD